MRIFDETKTLELVEKQIDREKGYLKPDKLFIMHHEAVEGKEAVYSDRIEILPNGSTQTWKDLITPKIDSKEAYDEFDDIMVYIPYSKEEIEKIENKKRYDKLKLEIEKIKEDIEQETFGIIRDDYKLKKNQAAKIVNELRVLEGKEPRNLYNEN